MRKISSHDASTFELLLQRFGDLLRLPLKKERVFASSNLDYIITN